MKKYQELMRELDRERLPRHIGIIMDGNGRWAKKKNRPRLYGHNAGAKSIREVVELGVELHLQYLTFYAFSTENWNRPVDEVQGLLKLLKERLIKEIPELNKQNIYVRFIGSEDNLSPDYMKDILATAALTHQNTGMVVNIAFNYGGRQEIVNAVKGLYTQMLNGDPAKIDAITAEDLSSYLYTSGQPDPDLIIRTSGEMRLSNFLLWQSAYSEIYVTETLWPDFDKVEMVKALMDYQKRDRRFGGLKGK